MKIKIGFEIAFDAPQPTPMVILLNIHPSRQADLLTPDQITTSPSVPIRPYHDSFGNECGRLFLPAGRTTLSYRGIVRDAGEPDQVVPTAQQIAVQDLPDQCILYLMPSRYCETDRLMQLAWSLFKDTPLGWPRVQAICDYVHNHLTFGYQFAAPTKSATACTRRAQRRVPRLRPPGGDAVSLHEHSRPLLHRLFWRHWRATRRNANGLQRVVRGLSLRHLVHIRRSSQHSRIGQIGGRGRRSSGRPFCTSFGETTLAQFTVDTDELIEA